MPRLASKKENLKVDISKQQQQIDQIVEYGIS